MQIVIKIDEKEYKRIIEGNWIGEAMAEIFENGTVLPDNPTNGDMIMTIFPNADIEYWAEYSTYNVEFPNDNDVKHFSYDWWNAPYERSTDANSD